MELENKLYYLRELEKNVVNQNYFIHIILRILINFQIIIIHTNLIKFH